MSGTKLGGQRAAKTNKKLHGDDFYARIGSMGGKKSRTGGFASEKVGKDGLTGRERASLAGAIGGLKSTRAGIGNGEGKKKTEEKAEAEAESNVLSFLSKLFKGKKDA